MRKILITGGTGFIGRALQNELDDGHSSIRALSRAEYAWERWDEIKYDAIIHLAPVSPLRAIRCAQANGCPFLYASSGAIYDKEASIYSTGKKVGEGEVMKSKLPYKIARLFTFAGPYLMGDYALMNFIRGAMSHELSPHGSIIVLGTGKVVRSYMYITDCARWLRVILEYGSGVYEVGSPEPVMIEDLAHEVAHNFDPEPEVHILNRTQEELRPYYVPNVSRAKVELRLDITVPFKEAIKRTVEAYKIAQEWRRDEKLPDVQP